MVLGTLSVPHPQSLRGSSQSCAHLSASQGCASKGCTGKLCGSLARGYRSGFTALQPPGGTSSPVMVRQETMKAWRPCLEWGQALRSNIHPRVSHGLRLILGPHLKPGVGWLLPLPCLPPSILLQVFLRSTNLKHLDTNVHLGSASGKDTRFAVRRPPPTETGCASGLWHVQELIGQQVSREIGWALRLRS